MITVAAFGDRLNVRHMLAWLALVSWLAATMALPVATGIALLRYRLDDIDRVTLSAELLTAVHGTVTPTRASLWLRSLPGRTRAASRMTDRPV